MHWMDRNAVLRSDARRRYEPSTAYKSHRQRCAQALITRPEISRRGYAWMDRRSWGCPCGGAAPIPGTRRTAPTPGTRRLGSYPGWDERCPVAVWSDAPLRRWQRHRGRSKGPRLKQNASHLLQSTNSPEVTARVRGASWGRCLHAMSTGRGRPARF